MKNSLEMILPTLMQQAKNDGIDRIVMAAVISKPDGEKVLCLKRAGHDFMPGLYELPSGKVENGEPLITALYREIKEETNLESAKLTDYLCSFDYRSQSGRLTRQLNFIAQCDDIKNLMIDNREHEGYTWLGSNELERYNISQETKSVIKTYFLRRDLEISPTEKMLEAWNQGIEGIVVGGVISQNDKVLLLKRANSEFNEGIYELPSGKLQKGESIEMGIVRKVKAETDLDVSRINKQLPHFDYRSSEGVLTRQLNYEIKANETSPIKLSLHHEGFTWAHAVELAAYPISKEVRSVVEGLLPKKHPAMAPAIKEQGLFKNKRGRDEEVNEEVNFKKANNVERKL